MSDNSIEMVILAIWFCLVLSLILRVWRPKIDKLSDGSYVIWYTSFNSGERNFKYIWKQEN